MFKVKFSYAVAGAVMLTMLQSTVFFDALSEFAPRISSQAFASDFRGYAPPASRKRIQRTDGVGSRGCPGGSFGSLNLLAPFDHIGLTMSARPTFSWYVSAAASTPMQFALVEPGVSVPIFVKRFKVNKSGIIQLTLPHDTKELTTGKDYRWTVSLVCNSLRPSENIYVRGWISRVPKSDLTGDSMSQTLLERGTFYAQSGIWYDAIAAISKAYLVNSEDPLNAKYLRVLLDQVGLSQVATRQPG